MVLGSGKGGRNSFRKFCIHGGLNSALQGQSWHFLPNAFYHDEIKKLKLIEIGILGKFLA